MRVAVLISGGKDSALALHRVLQQGHEVECLVTMVPKREDSWMFHYPNIRMADLFAEAVGIPLVKAETSGVKEIELEDLRHALSKLHVDAVVSGGISSVYQKSRLDAVCRDLGTKHVAPLWHENPIELLKEMMRLMIEALFVGVYAHGFDATWLGRKIDEHAVHDLIELNKEFEVSIIGEGGEYETLVVDAPFFKKRIQLIDAQKVWKGESGYLAIEKAVLVEKE